MRTRTADALAYERSAYQKSIGAFYTPDWLADLLVSWALRDKPGKVLDPSFGGCAFLWAAHRRLREIGVEDPGPLLCGVDIDKAALAYSAKLHRAGVPKANIRIADFLTSRAFSKDARFDAVLGNPPYIRHQALETCVVDRVQERLATMGITVPRTASAWAYFAIFGTERVSRGGRLALILPGALLHASYSEQLLAFLESQYGRVRLLQIQERVFQGTNEESVVLLAEPKGERGTLQYRRVRDRTDLRSAIEDASGDVPYQWRAGYKLSSLPQSVQEAWHQATAHPSVTTLGSIGIIRIGVVTGANDFFVRHECDEVFRSPFVDAAPVITARHWLPGPQVTQEDIQRLAERGERTRLMLLAHAPSGDPYVARALRAARRRGIHKRYKCSARRRWHVISDAAPPDLFLPYMGSSAGILTYNAAQATCTNAIHRVWLNSDVRAFYRAIVSSSHTSLFALAAEIYGRHYGGGVLKLEPGSAEQLPVIYSSGSSAYDRLVSAAKSARLAIADAEILRSTLRLSEATVAEIQRGALMLSEARQRRQRAKQGRTTTLPRAR